MATSRNLVVTSLSGKKLATFESVNLKQVTGVELKRMVADVVGFPVSGIKLTSEQGVIIEKSVSLEQVLSDVSSSQEQITIGCVVCPPRPLGNKNLEPQRETSFGSKAGMVLSTRLHSDERCGKPSVIKSRNPEPHLRKHIQAVLTAAFAEGMAPIIDMGVDAAFQEAGFANLSSESQDYIYEDMERSTCADLSSCRVWAYSMSADFIQNAGLGWLDIIPGMNPVVCAVLWRLLPSWEDKGTVLEVLFLATSPEMREGGFAFQLENDLESAAKEMGCCAIAVAAVPHQGMNFWTGRCGFEVVVPLKTDTTEADCLGEPLNNLGDFLLRHMLLFTDTPLVAKELSGGGHSDKDENQNSTYKRRCSLSRLCRLDFGS